MRHVSFGLVVDFVYPEAALQKRSLSTIQAMIAIQRLIETVGSEVLTSMKTVQQEDVIDRCPD
jgi:hypothetical protein